MMGPALRATLPARYPSALTPMRGTKLLGTLGSSATVAGSCARVAATNPMTPMIVHTKNCSRSGARTPPLVTKSPRDGWGGPAPLLPRTSVAPRASAVVPTLTPRRAGSPSGTSGSSHLHWTRLCDAARYAYAITAAAVCRISWNLDRLAGDLERVHAARCICRMRRDLRDRRRLGSQ